MNTFNVLYFALLAEQVGTSSEQLDAPTQIETAGDLQAFIAQRGGKWTAIDEENIRLAVNHTLCKKSHPLSTGDEVAFFPPVTGG